MTSFLDKKPMLHYDKQGAAYFGGSYAYLNATTAGTLVDASPTYVHRINITKSGDATSTITIYDGTSTSGAVVAVIDGSQKGSYEFGSHQPNGCFVAIAGSTSPTVTILYSSANTGG